MKYGFKCYTAFSLSIVILAGIFSSCGLFEPDAIKLTSVGTLDGAAGKIGEPFGIAARGDEIFVSDGEKGVIWKIDSTGIPAVFAKGFDTPSHIAFDQGGQLFVADSGDHTIRRVDPDGTTTIIAGVKGKKGFRDGPAGEALFNAPVGIATANGKVYIADTYNDRIRVLSDGIVETVAGGIQGFSDSAEGKSARFDTPTGLAVFGENLLVADTLNRRIRVVGPNGDTATLAGGGKEPKDGLLGDSGFQMPVGIGVDQRGAIFVTDGNSVRVIASAFVPIVRTISGGKRGFGDGSVGDALYNRPSGLAITAGGDLLVADSDNALVRVLTGSGNVKTLSKSEFRSTRTTAAKFRAASDARWPFQDYKKPREIAGTLGEIRVPGGKKSDKRWFHNGLDIAGGYGEEVAAVRTEKMLRPVAVSEFGTGRENIRFPGLGYIHMRFGRNADGKLFGDDRFQFRRNDANRAVGLRIPRGSVFRAGEILGTLNAMNHVHLIAGPAGSEFNALDALNLPGVSDTRAPILGDVKVFDKNWKEIEAESGVYNVKSGEKLRITVTAYDQMDGNSDRRRLGLYKLGYRILDSAKRPMKGYESTKWTIVFDMTPSEDSVGLVYAKGSRSGATGETVFNYILTNLVNGNAEAEDFIKIDAASGKVQFIMIYGADYFGNLTSKELALAVD